MSNTTMYVCSTCDAQFPKWTGQCMECGKWGTVALALADAKKKTATDVPVADVVDLSSLKHSETPRIITGVGEFDRVLGGGIVPGSLVLIGGDPGIGKSTLMLQIARRLGGDALYLSGEESAEQVRLRLERLTGVTKTVPFVATDRVDVAVKTIIDKKPRIAIIDSIQTIHDPNVPSEAGNVSQIRSVTARLLECAKENNIAILLVGHVTKEGALGGPKTLEHLVDCVIYFEGDQQHMFRLLRPVKNRFGATSEVGVFDMTEDGLVEVKDPSKLFSTAQTTTQSPGTIPTITMEGTRAFIVDVQALVSKTAMGYPVRKTAGFDANRLQLLIAVLQKRAGVPLSSEDVHVNIVGGLNAREPSFDLAVCSAIIGSFYEKTLSAKTAMCGEVGLSGEVRMVARLSDRIRAAENMGFKKMIIPRVTKQPKTTVELVQLETVDQLLPLFKV